MAPQWVCPAGVCPASAAPTEVTAPVLCPQVKCIILQVLKGLQYLHENYIIHRWERRDGAGGIKGCLGTPPTSWEQVASSGAAPGGGLVPISVGAPAA